MKVILIGCVCLVLGGCVPAITGLKEITTRDEEGRTLTTYSFITGADFRIGANGVDIVEDKRGIKKTW